jgi:predicted ATP-binding protein involved in virulence
MFGVNELRARVAKLEGDNRDLRSKLEQFEYREKYTARTAEQSRDLLGQIMAYLKIERVHTAASSEIRKKSARKAKDRATGNTITGSSFNI